MTHPMNPATAKREIIRLVAAGKVFFSSHAHDEMALDGVSSVEVFSVLRGGVVQPAEFERGAWRYRVTARSIFWRKK